MKYGFKRYHKFNIIVKLKKVVLSLCLTKHHSMMMYWGSEGLAPRILLISALD
jgi:hypothetical protein